MVCPLFSFWGQLNSVEMSVTCCLKCSYDSILLPSFISGAKYASLSMIPTTSSSNFYAVADPSESSNIFGSFVSAGVLSGNFSMGPGVSAFIAKVLPIRVTSLLTLVSKVKSLWSTTVGIIVPA